METRQVIVKSMKKVISKSNKETKQLAEKLASQLRGGDVLGLVGELGAGKTTFVQGLAEYFGVKERVNSPTFTLIQEYRVKSTKFKTLNPKQIPRQRRISLWLKNSNLKNSRLPVTSYSLPVTHLIHIDCYRLDDPQQLIEIGFEDYSGQKNTIIIIEWAEKVKNILPANTQWIYFEHSHKKNQRIIRY